ncbi:MAG: GIY-YIG nuclease family protein [Verrucomicrobiota bacterium]
MPKPKKRPSKAATSVTEHPKNHGSIRAKPEGQPSDVAAIRGEIQAFLRSPDKRGRRIGSAKCGVYAFYDYDGEPIYIGQTFEGLGSRIGRHLTNHRTDAVAMNVLDPFEVAEIRVWPIEPFASYTKKQITAAKDEIRVVLDRAEYTLFVKVVEESSFKAVLNEKPPIKTELVTLPIAYTGKIIPAEIFPHRKHPDIRIARRASTIAALARVISERKVAKGLRTTLLTQAKRLEKLADKRFAEFAGTSDEDEGETEGQD